MRLGERGPRIEYIALMIAAYAILPQLALMALLPWTVLIVGFSIPLAWRTARIVLTQMGAPLNVALGGTGQTVFGYSLLFFAALVLEKLLLRQARPEVELGQTSLTCFVARGFYGS